MRGHIWKFGWPTDHLTPNLRHVCACSSKSEVRPTAAPTPNIRRVQARVRGRVLGVLNPPPQLCTAQACARVYQWSPRNLTSNPHSCGVRPCPVVESGQPNALRCMRTHAHRGGVGSADQTPCPKFVPCACAPIKQWVPVDSTPQPKFAQRTRTRVHNPNLGLAHRTSHSNFAPCAGVHVQEWGVANGTTHHQRRPTALIHSSISLPSALRPCP